jgi:hypothetical protein
MLEDRRKTIFWTPCAAHCIDLMLEDLSKIKSIAGCVEKGKRITKFIYNHTFVLNLMRTQFSNKKEILRLVTTRFATNFIMLQSLLEHRSGLRKMMASDEWNNSKYSSFAEGKEMEDIILNSNFWRVVESTVKTIEPLVKVLRMVDGEENPTMGYLYEAMDRAKEAIKEIHDNEEKKYKPYWKIIDNRWENQLHHPLHAAAYYLNPKYHYSPQFSKVCICLYLFINYFKF